MRIKCSGCGKPVSTEVPDYTVIRAFIECPECIDADSLSATAKAETFPEAFIKLVRQKWPKRLGLIVQGTELPNGVPHYISSEAVLRKAGLRRITRDLPLSCISIDRLPLGPRVLALVDHLKNGGTVPPIHVQQQSSRYKILDGRHRYLAFKLLGRDRISARYGIRETC